MTLALMRMRNLILLMEKRRPWVSELILKRGTGESGIFIVERFFRPWAGTPFLSGWRWR
ncbi:heme exporter protein C [Salmonella enterica subsp. enterica]|uniref:Heme exporter protein C n=1 Tax=Salmonella enterica I TaxID=59201 RepID=A0A379W008_SALET|nr:heme exporter protein C [Salmonella enterica subsp. enterica]